MSAGETVSVLDLASRLGKRKQTIFKVLARLNIRTTKQRNAGSRGQLVACITPQEAEVVAAELGPPEPQAGDLEFLDSETGVFYLLALEPEHDPGRFKVGFASVLSERLQKHRCSAPLLQVVKHWPCKRGWEKTAIDAVTSGCERIHTEVFRAQSLAAVVQRCEQFFALMPSLPTKRDASSAV